MTEDEREELVCRLLDEFKESVGLAFDDKVKFAFIAGARAALVTMGDYPVPTNGGALMRGTPTVFWIIVATTSWETARAELWAQFREIIRQQTPGA